MTAAGVAAALLVFIVVAVSLAAACRLANDLAERSPPVGGDVGWLVLQPYGLVVGLLLWVAGNPRGWPLMRRSALLLATMPSLAVLCYLLVFVVDALLVSFGLVPGTWN